MLKKLSILLSLAAALAIGVVFAAPALAQTHHHHGSTHHSSGHYTVGHSYGGHVYYGHNRHRWHGRWYAYGVGPCWINVGGIWLWNVAACP